jgi:hypothetical protein
MSHWYLAHEDELLLDIDDYTRPTKDGAPWGEIFFRRRLRAATESGKLNVKGLYVAESSTRGHFQIAIRLERNCPLLERLCWQLHLGSDLYRGRADLMRAARGIAAPSLLIRPDAWPSLYRKADAVCSCTRKHVTSELSELNKSERCPIWQKYRGMSPWELFGPSSQEREKYIPLPLGKVPLDVILSKKST